MALALAWGAGGSSAVSPSRSQMTVMGLLRRRQRAAYLLLAADGGVRERPCLGPAGEEGEGEEGPRDGDRPSLRVHVSVLLRPWAGEPAGGLSWARCVCVGLSGGVSRERVRWKRGSVVRSSSAADMRKLFSERLPFFSSRALKVSLLVADLRRLRWMELCCRANEPPEGEGGGGVSPRPGTAPAVGVTGGEGEWPRERSSSDSRRPRTFRLDLQRRGDEERSERRFTTHTHTHAKLGALHTHTTKHMSIKQH